MVNTIVTERSGNQFDQRIVRVSSQARRASLAEIEPWPAERVAELRRHLPTGAPIRTMRLKGPATLTW